MTDTARPLRFGLVGTGYWARVTHAPALASTGGIELAAVWGRDPAAAGALAAAHGATGYAGLEEFLDAVDAVAFSVPPDVQNAIALRAAAAGKHLLLEKPIATSEADAEALAGAVAQAGVASVVFFTARFRPAIRAWLADVAARRWSGGYAVWLGAALDGSSPFNTPWRQLKGGLWDVGPHAVSLLRPVLGPVSSVTADSGAGDLTHLVLHHAGGATSTATLTLGAPPAAEGFELTVWGETGRSAMPGWAKPALPALQVALSELADNARSGRSAHPCDVQFGREVTAVLAQAQRQLDARRAGHPAAAPG